MLKEPDVCTDGLVSLQFSGELYLPSRGEKGDKFRELSAFYGDTHYNKPTYPGGPYVLCNEFERIDVISDRDFNDIPAGSSLDSVVELLAASAKPFIDSGYDSSYGWPDNAPAAYYRDGPSCGRFEIALFLVMWDACIFRFSKNRPSRSTRLLLPCRMLQAGR